MRLRPWEPVADRISLTVVGTSTVVAAINFLDTVFGLHGSLGAAIAQSNVSLLLAIALFFGIARVLPQRVVQISQIAFLLLLSGPVTLVNAYAFFGMWFFILGITLFYKYGYLQRGAALKLCLVGAYYLPFLVVSVLSTEGTVSSLANISKYFVFLVACIVYLFFIFETTLRELLRTSGQMNSALADNAKKIAQMEPLSVLGERVAHVTNSFKNHVSQLDALLALLEGDTDREVVADRLKDARDSLNGRIENILMVSRAGVDLRTETFDAARVLEGMKFVYLAEPSFAKDVWHEVTLKGPFLVRAVRWEFILMVENIFRNAQDAIRNQAARGVVKIDLSGGMLTISNNGGPMEQCSVCTTYCLDCPVHGRGTGGLAQVFSACRKNGWALRIRTENEWTTYQILLSTQN